MQVGDLSIEFYQSKLNRFCLGNKKYMDQTTTPPVTPEPAEGPTAPAPQPEPAQA